MRTFAVLALCALVGGCGLYRQKQQQEANARTQQTLADSVEECRFEYPDEIKQAVVRAGCINQSMEIIRGPGLPFPDLLDQENATRLALAEKVQAAKMTIIERNQQFSQLHSQIIAEEQRRLLANRSVNAQESAAAAQWRASNPVSCTKIGNTVNCY